MDRHQGDLLVQARRARRWTRWTLNVLARTGLELKFVATCHIHLSHQISPQAMIWKSHDMANFFPSPCVSWKSCSFWSVLSQLNCWLAAFAACSLQLWLYCINIAIATSAQHRCGLADLVMFTKQPNPPTQHSASAPSRSVYSTVAPCGTLAQQWLDMCKKTNHFDELRALQSPLLKLLQLFSCGFLTRASLVMQLSFPGTKLQREYWE